MFKRMEKNRENECALPAKRARYDTTQGGMTSSSTKIRDLANKKSGKSEDVWGDDFAEEDIEEMDIVASQACVPEDNNDTLSQPISSQRVSFLQRYNSVPSTSKNVPNKHTMPSTYMSQYNSHRKEGKNANNISTILSVSYNQFEDKLMKEQIYNSTFKMDNNELQCTNELERLKLENKKLLEDFITKEGEAVFLRNQLQQTQLRAENDRLEKMRLIEEEKNRHATEINAIFKEKEHLKTQLELQSFEIGNLMERCKLLGNGNVRLTEPQTVNLNVSSSKMRSPISSNKPVKVKESCVQTNTNNKSSYYLRIQDSYLPLAEIPKLIYDTPQSEKSIIDIQIAEKTGWRNLAILQEEDTYRIFENPDLVRPVSTMIDDKKLTTAFILPELTILQHKTSTELKAESTIPVINKLVSVARELILNIVIVLQSILQAMKNDDIRDMNDIYFSSLYSRSDFYEKSVCCASAWYECERGIETRRMFGVLSYVVLESPYLSKYIAGKTHLLVESDESYKYYSQQMTRYNAWPEKGRDFEMLRIILQFVVLVGSTRRAHQFSGLMCAIMAIICNVHKTIGYCSEGTEYIYKIFKEVVFSRPFPYCYILLTNTMTIFMKSTMHLKKLCANSQSMAVNNWKGSLHFTPDACPLQIFLAQVENHEFDLIAAVDIVDILLQFVQYILHTDIIPLRSDNLDSCNCCMKLVRFTIKTLYKCSAVDLSTIGYFNPPKFPVTYNVSCNLKSICYKHMPIEGKPEKVCIRDIYREKFVDENAWIHVKRKQSKILRDGIRFLSHLAICDPDFVIRLSDIENSFHLFKRNLNAFENFVLHENEQEAMNRIKQTFIFDKPQSEMEQFQSTKTSEQLDIAALFEETSLNATNSKKKENHSKFLVTMRTLFRNT